ncbi:MAG: hypothetical protein KKE23_00830 [Nanoarchaeota archaeon]|nr:hypothetical protein [Nanoarchaeota archaeon]
MDRGQLKIQEMAFVLLAIVLLGFISFIFYAKIQSENIQSSAGDIKVKTALSLRDKIAALPEIKCAEKPCIDKDKALMLKDYNIKGMFQGITEAKIIQIYPSDERIVLYSSGQGNTSYSTFVNLCEQKNIGGIFSYDCGLAILEVSI